LSWQNFRDAVVADKVVLRTIKAAMAVWKDHSNRVGSSKEFANGQKWSWKLQGVKTLWQTRT
jgi:hypothetical protein